MAAALAGRFELLGELGRGGMGVVLRARDRRTGTLVALKLLLEAGQASPLRRERFQREAALAARLDHPGLVRTLAHGEEHGVPWVASELVEGARTLDQVLPTLSLVERVTLVRDVARALGHAHGRGVVHRDVKPENVLVDQLGRARVTDFGLGVAADQARLTRTGTALGTPHFMPPEQVTGAREAQGPPSDVWSLGVVLYLALAERAPFDGEEVLGLARQICEEPPPALPSRVPPALAATCLAALEKDPARRPPDGTALAVLLERWLLEAARGQAGGARSAGVPALAALGVLGVAGASLLFSAQGLFEPAPPVVAEPTSEARPSAPLALPPGCEPGSAPGRARRRLPDGSALELAWVAWGERAEGERAAQGGFWLGVDEVPRGALRRWRALRDAAAPPAPAEDDALPAGEVSWDEAEAFASWAGLRLPTAAEWRRAAALDGPLRPAQAPALAPVGVGAPGPSGCRHVCDSAWEWLQDSLAQRCDDPLLRAASAPVHSAAKALDERLVGGAVPARAEPQSARLPALGLRLAGPIHGAPWRVSAVGFDHLPDKAKPPFRSFQELLGLGGPTLELGLPQLSLRLPSGRTLGQLPQARDVPGADRLGEDFFAIRAESEPLLEAGRWRLAAQVDDGLRVWIDGALVHDRWAADPHAVELRFELAAPRRVPLRVEMIEFYVEARLEVWLERLP